MRVSQSCPREEHFNTETDGAKRRLRRTWRGLAQASEQVHRLAPVHRRSPSGSPSPPPDTETGLGPTRKTGFALHGIIPLVRCSLSEGGTIQLPNYPTNQLFRVGATRRFRVPAKRGFRVLCQRRRCEASQARASAQTGLARGCGTAAPTAASGGRPRQRFPCSRGSAKLPPSLLTKLRRTSP